MAVLTVLAVVELAGWFVCAWQIATRGGATTGVPATVTVLAGIALAVAVLVVR